MNHPDRVRRNYPEGCPQFGATKRVDATTPVVRRNYSTSEPGGVIRAPIFRPGFRPRVKL